MAEDIKVELTGQDTDKQLTANRAAFFKFLSETFDDAPTEETVKQWKAQSGRVKTVSFGDDEVYFFRPLKAAEYKGLIQQITSQGGATTTEQQNDLLKERVVVAGVLWPRVNQAEMGGLHAGTTDSLYTMIMQASNFLTPEEAAVLVQDL
jgi:hypothetical protein